MTFVGPAESVASAEGVTANAAVNWPVAVAVAPAVVALLAGLAGCVNGGGSGSARDAVA